MRFKKLLLLLVLLISGVDAFAQTSECDQTLTQASDEFNVGHFYGIPAILKPCLDRGAFSGEQQVRAYLLLCQAYLIIDDPISAEDSYLKLLRADPEYVATDIKDPIDVVFLSKKFTSTPIFTPRLRLGGNTSIYRTTTEFSTGSNQLNQHVNHKLLPGFQFGVGLDYNFTDNFCVGFDALISYKAFRTITSNFIASHTLTVDEKQFWFDVPLYFKYTVHKGRMRPFFYAGAGASILLSARGSLSLVNETGNNSQTVTTGPDVKLYALRKTLELSVVSGVGVNYKVGKDFLFADLRYMGGINSLSSSPYGHGAGAAGKNMGDLVLTDLITQYGYADNKYRLDNVSITFGYVRPLYNPRKIKRAGGTGSVEREIKRQSRNEKK